MYDSDITWNDLEVAPKSAVMQSAKQFAETLGDTPQYREFEQSYFSFHNDIEAQKALQEFQKKQASLRALLILGVVSDAERHELQMLQERFYQKPSVIRYVRAQEELTKICQEIGDQLSMAIGLDYGASCRRGGCCG